MRMPDSLNHEVSGDGLYPTILFLHGFMGSSADWRGAIAALGDRYFCIAVDLPGHGASLGMPPDTYTIEGAARTVIGILNELEVVWNRETSRSFLWTGTASRSSRLWHGTRTCSVEPPRRGGATILQSWRAHCGGWEPGANRRCGESWKVSPCRRSPSPEGWMRSTPGSHRAWRASTREWNPQSSPERDIACTPRLRRDTPPCSGVLWVDYRLLWVRLNQFPELSFTMASVP